MDLCNIFQGGYMSLVPWKTSGSVPVSRTRIGDELASIQRDMNSLMGNFFNRGDFFSPAMSFDNSVFYPTVDVKEKEDKYLLDADMPGVNEADIDLDFHNNILTIKGEKKSEKETNEGGVLCTERSYGSFRRDISFDDDVDQEKIKAELKSGVLHIELAKKEKGKATHRKIAIK
jgi:HSP20 family protein